MASGIGSAVGSLGIGNIGANLSHTLLTIALVLIGGLVLGGVVVFVVIKKKYNKILPIYESINGRTEKTATVKAAEVPLNKEGDRVFKVWRTKKILPRPSIATEKNTYPHFITDDGEWINVGLGDFNKALREVGLYALHTDMRYARGSLRYSLEQRGDKGKFLEKYAPLIATGLFFMLAGIGMWLLFDKSSQVVSSVSSLVSGLKDVAISLKQAAGALAQSNAHSGIVSAVTNVTGG